MGVDVFKAIFERRSVRKFKSEPVPDELIFKIVEAGVWAPSAGNVQPWEVILIKNPETKEKLARAALNQGFIAEAPIVLVVCVDLEKAGWAYGERGVNLYCLQDSGAAIQNMLLAAYALGLGGCWVGAFYEDEIKKILGIPRGFRPVAIVPIGYPASKPSKTPRRRVEQVVHMEKF